MESIKEIIKEEKYIRVISELSKEKDTGLCWLPQTIITIMIILLMIKRKDLKSVPVFLSEYFSSSPFGDKNVYIFGCPRCLFNVCFCYYLDPTKQVLPGMIWMQG